MITEVNIPSTEPILIDPRTTAALIDISLRHLYALLSSQRIGPEPIKLGRRTVFNKSQIIAWADAGCPTRRIWKMGRKAVAC